MSGLGVVDAKDSLIAVIAIVVKGWILEARDVADLLKTSRLVLSHHEDPCKVSDRVLFRAIFTCAFAILVDDLFCDSSYSQ